MANEENLLPNSGRSREEVEALNRLGGINSGIVRRQNAKKKEAVKDIAAMVLGLKRKVSDKTAQQLKDLGIDRHEITTQVLAMMKIGDKATSGDIKAFECIRDTAGEKPNDNIKLTHETGDGAVILIGYDD